MEEIKCFFPDFSRLLFIIIHFLKGWFVEDETLICWANRNTGVYFQKEEEEEQ